MITFTERENAVRHYTVYDHNHSLVIVTTRYSVAQDFEYLVKQGHTALSLLALARKQLHKVTARSRR